MNKFKVKKRGFTLIEIMLVLTVIMVIAITKFSEITRDIEITKAKIAGEQIKSVSSAANNYIAIKYNELSNMLSANGSPTDQGPRSCSGNTCTITTQTLINEGLLPTTFSGKNINGSDYSIQLKRNGVAPNYIINGMVVANKSWSEGRLIRHDLLGVAMRAAGSDSGVTKNNTTISGYAGTWASNNTEYSIINKAGQLAQRVGFDSGLYTLYLRRDGSLPMTNDLNMNGKNIYNVKSLNMSGALKAGVVNATTNINSGGIISANGNVSAKNGYGDLISIGGDTSGNDYEIKLHSPKPLSIFSPNAANYTTVLQTGKGVVRVQQRLGLMGVDPNTLPAGWGGGLSTRDIYAVSGTIGAGTGGGVQTYLNSSGNIYASNNITSNTMTTNYIRSNGNVDINGAFSSNTVVSNYIKSNGSADAAGALYSRQINANNRLIVNEYMQVNGTAVAGNPCTPNGLIGREVSGQLLFCRNFIWVGGGEETGGGGGGGGGGGNKGYRCPTHYKAPDITVENHATACTTFAPSGYEACRGQTTSNPQCYCTSQVGHKVLNCTPL